VSPTRGDRVAVPPGPEEWEIRFHTTEAAKGWEELCRRAPGNTRAAWLTMRRNPAPPAESPRHHRLKYELATGTIKGRVLVHWQIEVTGAGQIWYLVDHETATIWIDYAGPAHPKATG
jgi:hypothetical protein